MMWRCPACGKEMSDEQYVCIVCGFDERKNFEKYPSLIPLDAAVLTEIEKMWRDLTEKKLPEAAPEVKKYGTAAKLKNTFLINTPEDSKKEINASDDKEEIWNKVNFLNNEEIFDSAKRTTSKLNAGGLKKTKMFEPDKNETESIASVEKNKKKKENIKWGTNLKHHEF